MPQENLEVIRRAADAVNRRDADAFVACASPDVEFEENTPIYPGLRRTYRGRTGLREWFQEAIIDYWDDFHGEIVELTEAPGGRVLHEYAISACGKASGVKTQMHGWQVFWVDDGLMTRRQVFLDRAEALEAAGLSDQDAHRADS